MAKLCPSAQPGMENCKVLGVVQHDGPRPLLLYLKQPLPATAGCARHGRSSQAHRSLPICLRRALNTRARISDGADCRLATRVARMLPPAVETLPPCIIRKECRWDWQEGAAACMRCP